MKLFTVGLLAGATQASHFRAGSFSLKKNNGQWEVANTQSWRRYSDGYYPCDQSDVTNQVLSNSVGTMRCNGCSTTSHAMRYQVTDLDDQSVSNNQWCYGYRNMPINPVSSASTVTTSFSSCCWVPMTDDNGNRSGGSYSYTGFNDISNDNATPEIKLPAQWKVIAGCPAQTINLAPYDADGDQVKCRWATGSAECGGACYDANRYASLTLNENTCEVTFDGTKDRTSSTWSPTIVKPIALMVEDFDQNGNKKSSMPLQFLVTVWLPTPTSRSDNRDILMGVKPVQSLYPDAFGDHDETGESHRGRRDVNTDHCPSPPVITTSLASSTSTSISGFSFPLAAKAKTPGATIVSWEFASPIGLTCSGNTQSGSSGSVTCTYAPGASSVGTTNNFCYAAIDSNGILTDRLCSTISVGAACDAENFSEMLSTFGNSVSDFVGYGCTCSTMDLAAVNAGHPHDDIDGSCLKRKQCNKCIPDGYKADYCLSNGVCTDAPGSSERASCECDLEFANSVQGKTKDNSFNSNTCVAGGGGSRTCCAVSNWRYEIYNSATNCCDTGAAVRDYGTC